MEPKPLLEISQPRVSLSNKATSSEVTDENASFNRDENNTVIDLMIQQGRSDVQRTELKRRSTITRADDNALRRAELGREEAISELRRVAKRLEVVMENYGKAKETHAHTKALWEMEIRRVRQESFKSQSMIVKLQEELKATRMSLSAAIIKVEKEEELMVAREKKASWTFNNKSMLDKCSELGRELRCVERERDVFKTTAKNEEIARKAAEIRLAAKYTDDFAFLQKGGRSPPFIKQPSFADVQRISELETKLLWAERTASNALAHVEFLKSECKLRCCSCRTAERKGEGSTDHSNISVGQVTATDRAKCQLDMPRKNPASNQQSTKVSHKPVKPQQRAIFIPSEGVFRTVLPGPEESPWISPAKPMIIGSISSSDDAICESERPQGQALNPSRAPSCEPTTATTLQCIDTSLLSLIDGSHTNSDREDTIIHYADSHLDHALSEQTHDQDRHESVPKPAFHTISTTTKIPLAAALDISPPSLSADLDALNPTMTREEALAQIKERRGRARSLAQGTLTPKKPSNGSLAERRDCSAPAVRSGAIRGRNATRF